MGPTWKVIAIASFGALVGIIVWVFTSFSADLRSLDIKKVDRVEYYQDIEDIKSRLDVLLALHLKNNTT
jgi:hypothetical protein